MVSKFTKSLWKSLGHVKWRLTEMYRRLSYRLVFPGKKNFVRNFWEDQAEMIHNRYGDMDHDFPLLGHLFLTYKTSSILDVGCGSGRLFGLYAQYEIQDVIGIDISDRALALARQRYPDVTIMCSSIEELEFPPHRFTMAVCNRVLQHIPPIHISGAVAKLCSWSSFVYINELSDSDDLHENFYMMRHDYPSLFRIQDFVMLENGRLGAQTYQVYGRKS